MYVWYQEKEEVHMDYTEQTIEMLKKIKNNHTKQIIYWFVRRLFLKQER